MKGSREDWSTWLPILTAFCNGEKIQKLGYDGRWIDAMNMYSLMCGARYRIKPARIESGVWTRPFKYVEIGSVSGPEGTGVMRFVGDDGDEPIWPKGVSYTADATFTPDEVRP